MNFRERLQLFEDSGFVHALKQTVALQAADIRRDQFRQIEPAQNFDNLFVRIVRSRAVAMPYNFVHEQTAISCE